MQTLIIAEKPSVAKSIAIVVGANELNNGYYSGNGYYVSYAFGHLYRLANANEYDPKFDKWKLENFPFIPSQFKYIPIENNGVLKQISIIEQLSKKSDLIINALDGDREGELIFAELKNSLKFNKPIKRLWLSSHTPKDVEKGLNNLLDPLTNLEMASYCRQQIDWILGINFTVLFTLTTGGNYTLNVGRVMLPTLKLIYDRTTSFKSFTSKDYYSLKSSFKGQYGAYTGTYIKNNETRFENPKCFDDIVTNCKDKVGVIQDYSSKITKEIPHKLFNLTDLQGYITSKYESFTGDKVLEVLQGLYEKKFVTYPRTASRFLNQSQIEESHTAIRNILDKNIMDLDPDQINYHDKPTVFDNSKVDSHPALMPTYLIPEISHLTSDERIIYLEIVKRFLSAFLPDAEYQVIEFTTIVEDHYFKTKSKTISKLGWKMLYSKDSSQIEEQDNKGEDDSFEIDLSKFGNGTSAKIENLEITSGKTKPTPLYTEKTLLQAMESCGKDTTDDDEVLKGFTIGTPVTRADTIKKLIKVGYIEKQKKNLIVTDLGIRVVESFPIKPMLNVSFTGKIEKTLKDIEHGSYDKNKFMDVMNTFVLSKGSEMKEIPQIQIEKITEPKLVIGNCPDCGMKVIENTRAFSCENTLTKKCGFVLWKDKGFLNKYNKKLTTSIAKKIITGKKVPIKGLISPKTGKPFDSKLYIEKDPSTGYWNFKFDFNS